MNDNSPEIWPVGNDGKSLEAVSLQTALQMLKPCETVYVYSRIGSVWMACDRKRSEVVRAMRNSPHVWLAGPGFASQGQGLVIWNGKTWWALETVGDSKGEVECCAS